MNNLFSIFDPVTLNPYLSLNWASMLLVIFFPSSYWLGKNKTLGLIKFILMFFSKELEMVLGKKNGSMSLILVSLFFYIWVNNFAGLLPYVFTSTSHLSTSLSLALPFWLGYFIINSVNNLSKTLAHLIPLGTPMILVPFMVLIEIVSNIMRPFTLSIRLAANMVAGHLLLSLLSYPVMLVEFYFIPLICLILSVLVLLEMGVSFIQGYVFMTLSSLYLSEINNDNNV